MGFEAQGFKGKVTVVVPTYNEAENLPRLAEEIFSLGIPHLKLLVVIDEFTRECLAVEVARSFTASDVKLTLQYLFAVRGAPQ